MKRIEIGPKALDAYIERDLEKKSLFDYQVNNSAKNDDDDFDLFLFIEEDDVFFTEEDAVSFSEDDSIPEGIRRNIKESEQYFSDPKLELAEVSDEADTKLEFAEISDEADSEDEEMRKLIEDECAHLLEIH